MKHLSITLIAIFVASQTLLTAQTNLDQYKYVSVPNRFDFIKSSDQFQISSLAKFLLTKNKFTVLENLEKYPADLAANQCLLLNLNVEQIKGFLKTKLEVQFLNCKNQVVFKSDIGMSREKDFKTAYHQALRAAFSSVSEANSMKQLIQSRPMKNPSPLSPQCPLSQYPLQCKPRICQAQN